MRGYRALERAHDAVLVDPLRRGVARGARDRQDVVMTLLLLDALGVAHPDPLVPVALYPELLAGYHDWHRRAGMDRAPAPGVCC